MVKEYDKDFDAVVNRSRNVAAGMSKGVQFLMKKNKIDVLNGFGKVLPKKQVSVSLDGKEDVYQADQIILPLSPFTSSPASHKMGRK